METQEEDDEEQEQEQEHDSSSSSSNDKKRSKKKRKRKAACTACHAMCAAAMHSSSNDNDKWKRKTKTKKSKREWPSLCFMAMLQFPPCHYSLQIGICTAEKLAEKGYRRRRRRRGGEGEGEGEGDGDEGVKVFVEGPAEGEVWPLNLSVKRRCFNRGWRHFVEANGLGHGDILLFTQICESHLAVRVFNSPAGHEKMFFPSPSPPRRLSAGARFRFHYHDNSGSSSNNTGAAEYDDDIVALSSHPPTTAKPLSKMQLPPLTSQERKNPPPEFAVQLTESAVSKTYRIVR